MLNFVCCQLYQILITFRHFKSKKYSAIFIFIAEYLIVYRFIYFPNLTLFTKIASHFKVYDLEFKDFQTEECFQKRYLFIIKKYSKVPYDEIKLQKSSRVALF